jgi:DNA-binding HxlR family transcriptional regulator
MAVRAKRRSVCPVACTLDLIGDKWTLLVVRDLFAGRRHYRDFLDSPEGIATNILAERLARLEAHRLVERYPSGEIPGRDGYRLTAKGRSLRPLLERIAAWGLAHVPGTEVRIFPSRRTARAS